MHLNEISENILYNLSFKNEQTTIKNDWKYSIWGRNQIKIKIASTGELAIQTVAQNTLDFLTSKFFKLFTSSKNIGKKVQSFNFNASEFPLNLTLLSEKKQKEIIKIQDERLGLYFLAMHKNLSDLGSELIKTALRDSKNCDQAVRSKIFDMCQEILDFQQEFTDVLQKDLTSAALYAKFQDYEKQAERLCKEFPSLLQDFIQKNKEAKETTIEELQEVIPLSETAEVLLTLKKEYLDLLYFARDQVIKLNGKFQFTSAEWLEKTIKKIVKQLVNDKEGSLSLKMAIESLEDALDCIEENINFTQQLQSLAVDSPYEQQLKDFVIAEIKQFLATYSEKFVAKEKEINELLKDSENSSWHQDLMHFFEVTQQKIKILAENYNFFESTIPGFETGLHWINQWIGNNQDPLIAIETLDRHLLIKHKAYVEHFCSNAFEFIQSETQVERIVDLRKHYMDLQAKALLKKSQLDEKEYLHLTELEKIMNEQERSVTSISSSLTSSNNCHYYVNVFSKAIEAMKSKLIEIENHPEIDPINQLIELKKLESPLYDTLRSKLINESKVQLKLFVDTLTSYQEILCAAIPLLKENHPPIIDPLINLEEKIKTKISKAQALMVDFITRLYLWQCFSSNIAVDELPPFQLKEYRSKVSHLVSTEIEEIIQEANNIGIKFN